jgi:hypothetical protein
MQISRPEHDKDLLTEPVAEVELEQAGHTSPTVRKRTPVTPNELDAPHQPCEKAQRSRRMGTM